MRRAVPGPGNGIRTTSGQIGTDIINSDGDYTKCGRRGDSVVIDTTSLNCDAKIIRGGDRSIDVCITLGIE